MLLFIVRVIPYVPIPNNELPRTLPCFLEKEGILVLWASRAKCGLTWFYKSEFSFFSSKKWTKARNKMDSEHSLSKTYPEMKMLLKVSSNNITHH
jgi:hypothetical protein